MRSRYAAYALGEVDYILATTDPTGPQFRADTVAWAADVRSFSAGTRFEGLEVLSAETQGDLGWVSFRARLNQAGRDASFGERSTFVREGARWLYRCGEPLQG